MDKTRIEGKCPVVWFSGPSGAGKTSLALEVQKRLNIPSIIIDGDDMRDSISKDAGFSREDRAEHNLHCARLAKELSKQMVVLVSIIAPMREIRKQITNICNPEWIYITRTLPERKGHFYEAPEAAIVINNDVVGIREGGDRCIRYLLDVGRHRRRCTIVILN